jgi:hypothetical protein
MDHEPQLTDRLDQVTTLLERTLAWLEQRALSCDVERISATIDPAAREQELTEKLAAAEREISELKAAATSTAIIPAPVPTGLNAQRRTVPASTADMLAKHGIGDGPVDVRALDAALTGLSLEQRIAVKSQLARAGAIA